MSTSRVKPRSGGRILVDQLALHGVELIFGVPGESYLWALDALLDVPIRFVNARHEAGAANMAEADGKLTGRPGVCFLTRGPGAAHGSIGLHTALQDSTPMVCLIGQVPRRALGREAFQEIDYRAMFAPLTKWVEEVIEPERIPELVGRAFALATSGRPGPVVLSFPEDVLAARVAVPDAQPYRPAVAAPDPAALARGPARRAPASRPLVIVGGGGWTAAAARAARSFGEASNLPVVCAWRCHDFIDSSSPSYAGHLGLPKDPALSRRVHDADVLLVVGDRLGDVTTAGYTLLDPPSPRQALIHVYPDPLEIARVYTPALAVVSGSEAFFAAIEPLDGARWASHATEARAEYLAWSAPPQSGSPLDLGVAIAQLAQRLAGEAIVVGDAGNFNSWVSRYLPLHGYRSQVTPESGAMGYGVPAAIAAKLRNPGRPVICFTGDGGFQMCGLELASAAQEGLPIVVIVVSNGMYGTIRAHQERQFPGRVIATRLANPDFALLAEACGAQGEAVDAIEQFLPALERALGAGRPALLELRVDPEAIYPGETISDIRKAAIART